jgi:hypothetical protein
VDYKRAQAQLTAPPPLRDVAQLHCYVVFNTPRQSIAALREAAALTRGLEARITVLAACEVPYHLPLHQPPVAIRFTEERLMAWVEQGGVAAAVRVYLCRDRCEAIRHALPAGSLVVIAGRKRWWPSRAAKLARTLERDGHRVVLAGDFQHI